MRCSPATYKQMHMSSFKLQCCQFFGSSMENNIHNGLHDTACKKVCLLGSRKSGKDCGMMKYKKELNCMIVNVPVGNCVGLFKEFSRTFHNLLLVAYSMYSRLDCIS